MPPRILAVLLVVHVAMAEGFAPHAGARREALGHGDVHDEEDGEDARMHIVGQAA